MSIRDLLLENKGVKQTIFKNTFWLSVATLFSKLLSLALLIYVARILGAEEYGRFTFALAFAALFTVLHDFGLPQIIIREFSREETNKKQFYSIISLNILLGLIVSVLILFSSLFVEGNVRRMVLILGLSNIVANFGCLFISLFQAKSKMEYRTVIDIIRASLLVALGFFIILNLPSAENLAYAYLLSAVLILPFILIMFRRKLFLPKIRWNKTVWKKFLLMSWPLALVGMFGILHNYVDSLMMGFWGMMTETGWYNAGLKIITGAALPGALISKSAYPLLSKFSKSREMLQKTLDHQIELMILLVIPLMVGGLVLAPRIIFSFYPSDFSPAILAFQILILGIGFIYLSRPFADLIVVSHQQKKFFLISVFGAVFNIILNLILIPKYSFYGAATATVITNLITFILYLGCVALFCSIRIFRMRFLLMSLIASLGSLLMYFVISYPGVYNLHIFLSVIIGAVAYFVGFLILKSMFFYVRQKI